MKNNVEQILTGKFCAIDGLTITKTKRDLTSMHKMFNSIKLLDKTLSNEQIISLFDKDKTAQKYLRLFINHDFDYHKIEKHSKSYLFCQAIHNHDMVHSLKSFKNKLHKSVSIDTNKYVKLLVDIKFYTRIISDNKKEEQNKCERIYKKGKVVKFAYQNKGCDLIVCQFGEHLFPLSYGEYEWVN